MTLNGWLQILLFFVVLTAITSPFGGYLTRVFAGDAGRLGRILGPVERSCYRLAGIDPPPRADTEKTFAELKERIEWTAAFVRGVTPEQVDGSEDRAIVIKTPFGELNFTGQQYLLGFVLPAGYLATLALTPIAQAAAGDLPTYIRGSLWLGLAATSLCLVAALVLAFARARSASRVTSQRPTPWASSASSRTPYSSAASSSRSAESPAIIGSYWMRASNSSAMFCSSSRVSSWFSPIVRRNRIRTMATVITVMAVRTASGSSPSPGWQWMIWSSMPFACTGPTIRWASSCNAAAPCAPTGFFWG